MIDVGDRVRAPRTVSMNNIGTVVTIKEKVLNAFTGESETWYSVQFQDSNIEPYKTEDLVLV